MTSPPRPGAWGVATPAWGLSAAMTVGVLLFNRTFSAVGYKNLHLIETLAGLGLLSIFLRWPGAPARYAAIGRQLASRPMWPFHALLVLGAVGLWRGADRGALAYEQSLTALSVLLVALFVFAFERRGTLLPLLGVLLVSFTLIIGLKILAFWSLGYHIEDEGYRVAHDEVDVIFAALAFMALLIFRGEERLRLRGLYWCLLFLNVAVLLLTMKRTAFLGLLAAAAFLLAQRRQRLSGRVLQVTATIAVALGLLSILVPMGLDKVWAIVASKADVLHERNAVWRLEAWRQGFERFRENPLFGVGFGRYLLEASLRGNPSYDPHNSLLAVLGYQGIVGLAAWLAMLWLTFRRYRQLCAEAPSTSERRLLTFCAAGFIFMTVFACFNVVLESPQQALFFWFFVSAAYFVRGAEAAPPVAPSVAGRAWPELSAWAVSFGLLAAYAFAVAGPSNRLENVTIYAPENGGQMPRLDQAADGRQRLVPRADGLGVELAPLPGGWCRLAWQLPEHFERLVPDPAHYVLEVTFDRPVDESLVPLFELAGRPATRGVNVSPRTRVLSVPLWPVLKLPRELREAHLAFGLHIPYHARETFYVIRSVALKYRQDVSNWPLYAAPGRSQTPTVESPAGAVVRAGGDELDVTLPGARPGAGSAEIRWRLPMPLELVDPAGAENLCLDVQLAARPAVEPIVVLETAEGRYVTAQNLTAGSARVVVSLRPYLKAGAGPLGFTLELPRAAEPTHLEIRWVGLRRLQEIFELYDSWTFFPTEPDVALPTAYHQAASAHTELRLQPPFLQVDVRKPVATWSALSWTFPKVMSSRPDFADYVVEVAFRDAATAQRLAYAASSSATAWLPAREVHVCGRTVQVPLRQFSPAGLGTLQTFSVAPAYETSHSTFDIESVRLIRPLGRQAAS